MQSESPARYNIAAKRSFKVEHHFDQAQEILNFDLPSGVGYDYLNYPSQIPAQKNTPVRKCNPIVPAFAGCKSLLS